MNSLTERVEAGRELAVQLTKETEPEVSWFVEAAKVDYDRTTGEPTDLMVIAHFRSYHRYEVGKAFGNYSVEAIAEGLISCIRNALELGMLVADDPPMAKGLAPLRTPLVDLRDARLAELHGGVIPSAVLEKRREREERERREEAGRKLQGGPPNSLSGRVTTYVYDIASLRERQKEQPPPSEGAPGGHRGGE